jgi:hypothetical protein
MLPNRRVDPVQILDDAGNIMFSHITNVVSIANLSTVGYKLPNTQKNYSTGFKVCPLEAGTITGRLVGQGVGEYYTMPTVRTTKIIGSWSEEVWAEIITTDTTVDAVLIGFNS